jgi:hypothetical protein
MCSINGCGAANLGVVCAELDTDHYICKCPNTQDAVTLEAGEVFECDFDGEVPPTIEDILARVNTTNLVASLVNGVFEVLGAAVVTIDGNSFTLEITATVEIDGLTELLAERIAFFLGAGYTPEHVHVEWVTKRKRASTDVQTGTARITVRDDTTTDLSPANHVTYSLYGMLALLLASSF